MNPAFYCVCHVYYCGKEKTVIQIKQMIVTTETLLKLFLST